jgi:hypothetical protein
MERLGAFRSSDSSLRRLDTLSSLANLGHEFTSSMEDDGETLPAPVRVPILSISAVTAAPALVLESSEDDHNDKLMLTINGRFNGASA